MRGQWVEVGGGTMPHQLSSLIQFAVWPLIFVPCSKRASNCILPFSNNTSAQCPSTVSTVRRSTEKAKTHEDMSLFPHVLHERMRVAMQLKNHCTRLVRTTIWNKSGFSFTSDSLWGTNQKRRKDTRKILALTHLTWETKLPTPPKSLKP